MERGELGISWDSNRRGLCLRGFTLLEVMVAFSILAIVLLAVFQSQSYSVSLTRHNKFFTTASYLARTCAAEIEITGHAATGTMKGTFGDDYPGYSWQVEVLSSPFPGTKKIKITVTNHEIWPDKEYVLYYYVLAS